MLLGWRDRVCDLDYHEQRCRLRQFLLPTEQDTLGYPIAAGHLCKARIRQYRLLK